MQQIKTTDVTDYWDNYLGSNQTNINPRTGQVDADRIFADDGCQSASGTGVLGGDNYGFREIELA